MPKDKIDYFNSEHLKQGLKGRSIKSAGVTLFSQVFGSIIKVVGAIILARLLDPEDFGLLSMTATFILLLQNFGVNGFTEAIVQEEKISHRQVSSLFWINIAISVCLAGTLTLLSPMVAAFYNDERLVIIVKVMSISIIMGGLSTQHMALMQRNMQFTRISILRLTAAVSSVAIGITLAHQEFGYWALVARRLSLPALIAIGAWVLCRWVPGIPKIGKKVKELFLFGMFTYGNYLLNYLRVNIDKILVGRFLGTEQLGYYDRAYHLANQIPQQMTVPISGVLISTLSKLRNEEDRYKRYVNKLLSTLGLMCMPISALLTIIGKDVIVLLLGAQWQYAGTVFTWMGPGIGMLVIYNTHAWIHLSLGNAKRLFSWGMFALTCTIFLFIVGLRFGTVGVAAAYSSSFLLLTFPALHFAGKVIGLKIMFFVECFWRPLIAALLSGLATYHTAKIELLSSQLSLEAGILSRIFVSTGIFTLIYIILIVVLFQGFKPFSELMSILVEIAPEKFKRKKARG